MANVGEQLKKALADLKAMWQKLDGKKQKLVALVAAGVLTLMVGVTFFLNFNTSGYEVLYAGMEQSEVAEVFAAVQGLEPVVKARMNSNGEIEVPKKEKDRVLAELAIKGVPKSGLPYDIFPANGSLTTTDLEKRKQIEYQLNNRLQDTLRQFPGIKSAVVTISLAQDSNRVWEVSGSKSTASVTLHLQPGVTYSKDNVTAVKTLVASSVGYTMDPKDVMVIDAATSINLPGRDDTDSAYSVEGELQRLGYQDKIDQRYADKAMNVLSLFIEPTNLRITATIKIDYNKMVTESKDYVPSGDSNNNSGVLSEGKTDALLNPGSLAGGLPGEEDNTDPPPAYVDLDGDGNPEFVDYHNEQKYLVSYIMQQIEKNEAEIIEDQSSVAVTIKGDIDEDTRLAIIESTARATGIPEAKVSVQNYAIGDIPTDELPAQGTILEGPVLYILIGVMAGLLILLLLVVLISNKRKKKKLAAATAAAGGTTGGISLMDPHASVFSSERELEERKRQIQDAAQRSKNDNAIAEEVREFAKQNPQITANLLRNWLKEEEL